MTLEQKLQQQAIYSTKEEVAYSKISDIIDSEQLELIGMGLLGRSYKIKNSNWVVKEGRWDPSIEIFFNLRMKIPGKLLEIGNKYTKFTFLPSLKEAIRQYSEYQLMMKYFGYFQSDEIYYHPEREKIFKTQNEIRNKVPKIIQKINQKYKTNLSESTFTKEELQHNFLPKEYFLFGKSISKQNKEKDTYLIFQEFVEGLSLRNFKIQALEQKTKRQLKLLVVLMLGLYFETGKLVDTRPKYPVIEFLRWLDKTDNIFVDNSGNVKFIDTRWMWDSKKNLFARGFVIPELCLWRGRKVLNCR
jgi:hypothetical protein